MRQTRGYIVHGGRVIAAEFATMSTLEMLLVEVFESSGQPRTIRSNNERQWPTGVCSEDSTTAGKPPCTSWKAVMALYTPRAVVKSTEARV